MMQGGAGQFPMNAGGVPPQQQIMQRMHPSQQNPSGMNAAAQRGFNPAQGTPNNAMPGQQGQFPTPQSQTPTSAQAPNASVTTPQTPTFPNTGHQMQANGTAGAGTPLSPGNPSRDKERFGVLLDINQELLYESIQLQNTRNELKREMTAESSSGARKPDTDYMEEEALASKDYNQ